MGQSSCVLRFGDGERLSRLECSVEALTYACTRPRDDYVCSWSDDRDGADVYDTAGSFSGYRWGRALEPHLGPGPERPGGVEGERAASGCPADRGDARSGR
jgi:hypothetical protein